MDIQEKIDELDDHTREGIALALKGMEFILRFTVAGIHIKLMLDAWKSGPLQKRRILQMVALSALEGSFSFTGRLFKDLKLGQSSEAPPWARDFRESLRIRRSM